MSGWSSSKARRQRRAATAWDQSEWHCKQCGTGNWMSRRVCRQCSGGHWSAPTSLAASGSRSSLASPAGEREALQATLAAIADTDETQALRSAVTDRLASLKPPVQPSAGTRLDQAEARCRRAVARKERAAQALAHAQEQFQEAESEEAEAQEALRGVRESVVCECADPKTPLTLITAQLEAVLEQLPTLDAVKRRRVSGEPACEPPSQPEAPDPGQGMAALHDVLTRLASLLPSLSVAPPPAAAESGGCGGSARAPVVSSMPSDDWPMMPVDDPLGR